MSNEELISDALNNSQSRLSPWDSAVLYVPEDSNGWVLLSYSHRKEVKSQLVSLEFIQLKQALITPIVFHD